MSSVYNWEITRDYVDGAETGLTGPRNKSRHTANETAFRMFGYSARYKRPHNRAPPRPVAGVFFCLLRARQLIRPRDACRVPAETYGADP